MKRVFVFGIDGAMPELVFGDWLDELPNIKKLIREGGYARLNSSIPPLSVTAWTSIITGKSSADTGIFEYIYRKNHSYEDYGIITSNELKEKTVWEIISDENKKSVVCYIPLTWPIKKFNGWIISDSLFGAVKDTSKCVYPLELKNEIESFLGGIPPLDMPNFRDLTKEQIIEGTQDLESKRAEIMKYLIKSKDWDYFFAISGMSDRMNHTFWKYVDKGHRKYDPNSKFRNTLKDYYKFVDGKLGEILELLDKDTTIIVLSDHGITRMHTRVNLTDWLIKEGYMVLKNPVKEKCEFKFNLVDWSKTSVFAIGAYEGQIFINLKGREPAGIVEEKDYNNLIKELSEKLKGIRGDNGKILDTKIFNKEEHLKGKYENIAPDIIVYFDNLEYGCNTTLVGNETLWSPNTAKGSDDAAHSRQGIFIIKNNKANGNLGEISAIDVAPTILNELGLKIPEDMRGKIIGD